MELHQWLGAKALIRSNSEDSAWVGHLELQLWLRMRVLIAQAAILMDSSSPPLSYLALFIESIFSILLINVTLLFIYFLIIISDLRP